MSQFEEIINSDMPVLIDFSAEWCGPCKAFAPVLKEIAGEVDGKARVIKIDIDRNQEAAMAYGIQSVPTLMIIKKGEIKWRQSGALPKDQVVEILSRYY